MRTSRDSLGQRAAVVLEAPQRRVPLTRARAVTELVQCRRHLVTARESLEVAVEILERLNGKAPGTPTAALQEVLGELEEAEAVVRSALG